MGKNILFVSGFNFKHSGYSNIAKDLCLGLVADDYSVTVLGLGYMGESHEFPFSIIPTSDIGAASAMIRNFQIIKKYDVVISAMDVPMHLKFMKMIENERSNGLKYVAITALENGPMCMEWTLGLYPADKIFFISKLGEEEAHKVGLDSAEHFIVGLNLDEWKFVEDKSLLAKMREKAGYSPDDFIVLCIAANQERKNLRATFDTIKSFKDKHLEIPIQFLLVSFEYEHGFKLDEIASELNLTEYYHKYERGMTQEQLNVLYNISDVFLLTSKAEGLGMPILESMATKTPVVASDTGAITDLLSDGRGLLIKEAYRFRDVWGESWRVMIDPEDAADLLYRIYSEPYTRNSIVEKAYEYIKSRKIVDSIKQLTDVLEKFDEQKEI